MSAVAGGVFPSARGYAHGRKTAQAGSTSLLMTLIRREAARRGDNKTTSTPYSTNKPERDGYCGRRERAREVEWLVRSCAKLGLHTDCLSLAVAIFDAVIAIKDVQTRYANCVATASLYIAKKLCEDDDESPTRLLSSLQLAYTPNDLKKMELLLLNVLEWDALLPSVERFASAQLCHLGAPWVLPYLRLPIEAALKNGAVMRAHRASHVSLAIVSLVLERFCSAANWTAMTAELLQLHKLEWSDILAVREAVGRLLPPPVSVSVNPFGALADHQHDGPQEGVYGLEGSSLDLVHTELLASPRPLQPTQC